MSTFDAGSIRADVELDATPFKRGLADLKREGERFAQNKFSPKIDADDTEARRKINSIKLQLSQLSGTTRVNVDVAGNVGAQLDEIAARREALDSGDISINVTLNRFAIVSSQLRLLNTMVDRLDGRNINMTVNADTAAARAQLASLQAQANAMRNTTITPQAGGNANRAAGSAGGGMLNLAAGAAAAASALSPVVTVAAGVTAGLISMAAAGGGAAAVFGGVLVGALKQYQSVSKEIATANKNLDAQKEALSKLTPGTQEYATQLEKVKDAQQAVNEAQSKLTPSMSMFDKAVNQLKNSWSDLIKETSPQTFGVMTPVLQGVTSLVERMGPVVRAVAPVFQAVANSFKNWAEGEGGTKFMNFLQTTGVPILADLVQAGKNVILTAGGMIKAFAPPGTGIAQSLATASAKMREWSDQGGFSRFLTKVKDLAPLVKQFFAALGPALVNVGRALQNLGPLSLLTATGLLKIVAALPPPLLSTLIALFIAWRAALIAHRIAVQASALGITRARIATVAHAVATRASAAATVISTAAQRAFAIAMTVGRAALAAARVAIMATATAMRVLTVAMLANPIGIVILAIVALVAAFILLWKRCDWFRNFWKAAWRDIQGAASATWNFIRDKIFAPLGRFFTQTIPRWAGMLKDAVVNRWNGLRDGIKAAYNWINNNVFQPIGRFFTRTIPGWANTLWKLVSSRFWGMIYGVRDAYNMVKRNVFTPLGNFFTKTIPGWARSLKDRVVDTWNALWKKLGDIWTGIKNTAKRIWDDIGGVIEGAINGAINLVNGLIHGFNNITKFLKIDVHIDDIPKVHFAQGGMVPGGVSNFSGGGFVPGYSPGNDTVPAMLSPGEGVLTPEAVRGLGGPGFIHGANRQFAGHRGAGKQAPMGQSFGFATGGIVPVQHFYVGGMVQAALARAGVSLGDVTQGEYSNGSLSAGTHSGGGVVDLAAGPGSQDEVARLRRAGFAAWLRTPSEGFAYHIHAVLMNSPNLSPAAQQQVVAFRNGRNGLANNGPDTGPAGTAGIDIVGEIKKSMGKILQNVYRGGKALAGIAGGVADFFSGGGGGNGGLFGLGVGPDFGPDVVGGASKVAGKLFGASGTLGQAVLGMITKSAAITGLSDGQKKFDAFDKGGLIANIVKGMGKQIIGKFMPDFLVSHKKDSTFDLAAAIAAPGAGSGVQRWATLASMALRIVGINGPNALKDFLGLMNAESGGNPNAVNNYDINARNGVPSQGLMQVIPPTFRTYHVPGTSNNILDPLANMAASANYIKHVYGGRIPGSPYYTGVMSATAGMHSVGEHAAELVTKPGVKLFSGGERVYNGRETGNILGGGGSVAYVPTQLVVQMDDTTAFKMTVVDILDDTMDAVDRSR